MIELCSVEMWDFNLELIWPWKLIFSKKRHKVSRKTPSIAELRTYITLAAQLERQRLRSIDKWQVNGITLRDQPAGRNRDLNSQQRDISFEFK